MKTILSILFILSECLCRADMHTGTATVQHLIIAPQLAHVLSSYISTLAANTNATETYSPSAANLGTNSAVWTWPVNLSCVGKGPYQSTLIASNLILANQHYGGNLNQQITWHDTNGIAWTTICTQAVYLNDDISIGKLSNSAPASIVLPWILPAAYTNYLPAHSLVGIPCVWLHNNTSQLQYSTITVDQPGTVIYGPGNYMTALHNTNSPNGVGTPASGGDSGSPAFVFFGNQPVILFAASTLGSDVNGDFISGGLDWSNIVSAGLTNGLQILNLTPYWKF